MTDRVAHTLRLGSALAAIAALLLSGCEKPAPAESANVPAPQVRDSSGVRIVSAGFSRDSLRADERLTVRDTLLNGASQAGEAVVGLIALQPLADSSLVLFSESGPSLLRFTAPFGSRAPDTFGYAGTAPGAYSAKATVLPYLSDTLLLWDAEPSRLSRISASGIGDAVILNYASSRVATVSGAWRDGTAIGVTVAAPGEQRPGVSRAPMALLRFGADGSFRDTLVPLRGPERSILMGQPTADKDVPVRVGNVPFGRTSLWAVGSDNVLVLDTENCHVNRYDSTRTLQLRVDFHCVIEAVTEQDKAAFLGEVMRTARSRSDSAMRSRIASEASFAPAKPTASGLLTDAWDRIWVRLPVRSATDDWVWWVFDRDGMPLSRIGFARQWRIASIRERDIIVVESERDDAPPVVATMSLPPVLQRTP